MAVAIYLRQSPNVELFVPKVALPGPLERMLCRILALLGLSTDDAPLETDEFYDDAGDADSAPHADAHATTPVFVSDGDIQTIIGSDGILDDGTLYPIIDRLALAFNHHRDKTLEL